MLAALPCGESEPVGRSRGQLLVMLMRAAESAAPSLESSGCCCQPACSCCSRCARSPAGRCMAGSRAAAERRWAPGSMPCAPGLRHSPPPAPNPPSTLPPHPPPLRQIKLPGMVPLDLIMALSSGPASSGLLGTTSLTYQVGQAGCGVCRPGQRGDRPAAAARPPLPPTHPPTHTHTCTRTQTH